MSEEIKIRNSGLAISGFVISIVGILGCFIPLLNIISIWTSVIGLVLSFIAFFVSKSKKQKSLFSILGIIFSILSIIIAFTVNKTVFNKVTNNPIVSETGKINESDTSESSEKGVFNNCYVEILSARIAKKDSKIAIVKFKFTNNNEQSKQFNMVVVDKAFQNGIECEKNYLNSELGEEILDRNSIDIQKGTTIELEICYKLNDNSPLTVEISEAFSVNPAKLIKNFEF